MPEVHGIDIIDGEPGCTHWRTARDIVALKCPCHQKFYACLSCHEAEEGAAWVPYPKVQWNDHAILCRACNNTLSINAYRTCNSTCPHCKAEFNPGCATHWDLYFEK